MTARKGHGRQNRTRALRIWRRDNGLCHLCGQLIDPDIPFPNPGSLTRDHVDPDGPDNDANTSAAHYLCNQKRGRKPVDQARRAIRTQTRQAEPCTPLTNWTGTPELNTVGSYHVPCAQHWKASDPDYYWLSHCGDPINCLADSHTASGWHERCSSRAW